jgi:putative ABC transport system ATP-binding protein
MKEKKLQNQKSKNNNGFVHLKDVTKIYHTPAGDFNALNNIHLTIKEGQFVSIVGKSGSGKSTLINMITGIDHPSSGEVIINGESIQGKREGDMALWRGRNMGIVFQFFQLLPMLTILENTLLPMDFCNQHPIEARENIALDLLDQLDLKKLESKFPLQISAGHQQCAAIARALANDPPILLADEPTGNLDSKTAEMVMSIFERLMLRKKTIIMVTHDRQLAKRAERVLILSDGNLISEDISDTFDSVDDTILVKIDKGKHEVLLGPGGSFNTLEYSEFWFGLLVKGSLLLRKTSFIPTNKNKKKIHKGELIDLSSQNKTYIAEENCRVFIIPKSELIGLTHSETNQVVKTLQKLRHFKAGSL